MVAKQKTSARPGSDGFAHLTGPDGWNAGGARSSRTRVGPSVPVISPLMCPGCRGRLFSLPSSLQQPCTYRYETSASGRDPPLLHAIWGSLNANLRITKTNRCENVITKRYLRIKRRIGAKTTHVGLHEPEHVDGSFCEVKMTKEVGAVLHLNSYVHIFVVKKGPSSPQVGPPWGPSSPQVGPF